MSKEFFDYKGGEVRILPSQSIGRYNRPGRDILIVDYQSRLRDTDDPISNKINHWKRIMVALRRRNKIKKILG